MKEVVIEYRKWKFIRAKTCIPAPEEWIELIGQQFVVCCRMFTEPISDIDFISEFFGIKKSLAKRLDKFCQYKLIELAGFVAFPKAMVNFCYLTEIPGTELRSPDKRLHSVTFERFMLFDTLFFDYMNDKKPETLAKFIATLYLKRKEIVNKIDIDKRVNFIAKKVDKTTQYAIFLNYTFIRKWLSKAFPLLFGFTEADLSEKNRLRPQKPNRPNWNAVLEGLVGDDVIHYEQYKQMPCTVAFRTINKRIQNYNRYGK
jgi:hypothetical protein